MSRKVSWPVFLYIAGYHLFLAIALPIYLLSHTPSLSLILISAGLVFISGIAITAGYHRLYSHSCYKTHPVIEAILLFFASVATQGSALRWCNDHRLHHAFVDTDKDPYSVKKGLLHAHVLWMFFRSNEIDPKVVSDLSRNKLIQFQHKHYVFCMLASNILCFLAVGWLLNDYLGAFFFVWWVRLLVLHHTTWCINSLAHFWGTQMYSREHSAVDNYLISLLTYGEGYHNYHHTFAYDYRNGIRWYHFDPAKWMIWTLHKFGLAHDLKRVNNYRIARQLLLDHKNRLVESIKKSYYIHRDSLEAKVTQVADTLSQKLTQIQTLLERSKDKEIVTQVRALKKSLKKDWREWKEVVKTISRQSPKSLAH
ncbi:MAG: fatty acid desaturase [Chlamydiae bacterium RIFCSPHIGHO2_12_FULL_49_9]|nr:MAG: fatty acid desaturase [Chlamydiae bacterium RIFCSPHIGHO2_12_FULL_49_9]